MGVVAPRPDEKHCHQGAVVEVVDRPHLVQLVGVGVVEDLHCLAREVVAEEDCSRDVAKIPMASLENGGGLRFSKRDPPIST